MFKNKFSLGITQFSNMYYKSLPSGNKFDVIKTIQIKKRNNKNSYNIVHETTLGKQIQVSLVIARIYSMDRLWHDKVMDPQNSIPLCQVFFQKIVL